MGERTPHDSVMEASHIKTTTSYPLELQYIKALFLHQQYRLCITTCRDHLKANRANEHANPLLLTFVQFYLALAHDELARAMPSASQAKVPAFSQAEQFYLDALLSLPTSKQCVEAPSKRSYKTNSDPLHGHKPTTHSHNRDAPPTNGDSPTVPRVYSSPNLPHIRNDSLSARSPALNSPDTTASDPDDLESNNSFSQIVNSNRIPKLQRDYSSMSLLQPQQQQVSQDPAKAIRPGDTPNHYGVHSKYSHLSNAHPEHRLPKLHTSALDSSPVRKQLRTVSEQASPVGSPVSPVSPLGPDDLFASDDDDSAISPILPDRAPGDEGSGSPYPTSLQQFLDGLNGHLDGMRIQLEKHLKLLREAKKRTLDARAERIASRTVPTDKGNYGAFIGAAGNKDVGMQSSHRSWSSTPEDVKQSWRRSRIEAGREKRLTGTRFDPARYQGLAERALAEL